MELLANEEGKSIVCMLHDSKVDNSIRCPWNLVYKNEMKLINAHEHTFRNNAKPRKLQKHQI